MNLHNYKLIIIGIIIGWITKFPFLLKWYRELKETQDYRNRKHTAFTEELKRLGEILKK